MARPFFNLLHTFSIGLRSPLPGGNLIAVRPFLWYSASTFQNVSLMEPHPQPLEASTLVHNKFLEHRFQKFMVQPNTQMQQLRPWPAPAWEAALFKAGTCSIHSSFCIFDVGVHCFKANPPCALKPPHSGTLVPSCEPYSLYHNQHDKQTS